MNKKTITIKIPEDIYYKLKEDIAKSQTKYKGYMTTGEFISLLILEYKSHDN